jgi:hypothetical protein
VVVQIKKVKKLEIFSCGNTWQLGTVWAPLERLIRVHLERYFWELQSTIIKDAKRF